MQVSATDAKNRFGYYCTQAKVEPVVVEKDGRPDTVLLGFEEYQRLKRQAAGASLEERRLAFNEQHKDWIREQNEFIEKHGVFGEDLRPW